MGRYKFKREDLAPLRKFLDLPGAREVIEAAAPVKRFVPSVRGNEEFVLPVPVKSRESPDGVPLDAILSEAQKESGAVQGIMVRGGVAVVTYKAAPSKAEVEKLRGLLSDASRLGRLRVTKPPDDNLRRLRDEAMPDQEWLRAFRRYAVQNLLKEN